MAEITVFFGKNQQLGLPELLELVSDIVAFFREQNNDNLDSDVPHRCNVLPTIPETRGLKMAPLNIASLARYIDCLWIVKILIS